MNEGPLFSKQDQAMQDFLLWVTDGEPLTTEAEREEHESLNSVTVLQMDALLVLDVAA